MLILRLKSHCEVGVITSIGASTLFLGKVKTVLHINVENNSILMFLYWFFDTLNNLTSEYLYDSVIVLFGLYVTVMPSFLKIYRWLHCCPLSMGGCFTSGKKGCLNWTSSSLESPSAGPSKKLRAAPQYLCCHFLWRRNRVGSKKSGNKLIFLLVHCKSPN